MPVTPLVLLVNGILLFIVITLMLIVLRWGSQHDYNYGLDIQAVLKSRLRWLLMTLIALSLGAALFNIIASYLNL